MLLKKNKRQNRIVVEKMQREKKVFKAGFREKN